MRTKKAAAGPPEVATMHSDMTLTDPDVANVPTEVANAAPTEAVVDHGTPVDTGAWMTAAAPRRGLGDRMARLPEASRELAQTTARRAVRAGQWLLGR